MTLRLSEYPEYMAAVPAAAAGDFASARTALQMLIAKIEGVCAPEDLAYVIQLLAEVEAQSGDIKAGLALQERALSIDRSSPLLPLLCAKSLVRAFRLPALALERLGQAESLLASDVWKPSPDDLSRQSYEHEIQLVREEALRAQRQS